MKPSDVIVTVCDSIVIIEPQTRQAADWLKQRLHTNIENVYDQIYVDIQKYHDLVVALKEAGFTVLT